MSTLPPAVSEEATLSTSAVVAATFFER